jgi:hypothetical protein
MKIQVVKKASAKAKSSDPCPFLVEMPPETARK